MTFREKEIPAAAVASARRLYEETRTPLAEIARGLGVAPATFRRRLAGWGFSPRGRTKPPRRKPVRPPREAPAAPDEPARPLDTLAMAERVGAALQRALPRIEASLEAGKDVERQARALASLVKTLGDLKRLENAGAAATDEPGRDLAGLREELARRLGLADDAA